MSTLKSGLRPIKHDHRDFDYFKSKKLGAVISSFPAAFPDSYNTDAKLWIPNQNAGSTLFTPPVPPMPYGCTNYTQSDLCADEDKKLYSPLLLENITHANANGGSDLRTSLNAATKNIPGHPAYFNIRPSGAIDWFDAIRLAMISASSENRSVSIGSPWFPEFTEAEDVVPMPSSWSLSRASWHNYAIKGWKSINGQPFLIVKPWLGQGYADAGFSYFSRTLFNALMNISGSAAFTIDKLIPGEEVQKVDSTIVQWIVSYVRFLFGL